MAGGARSQERFSHPDGRRSIRFFLEDASGAEVLAVMGEERETRDGHYVYRTEPAFAGVQALCCGNMSDVNRWLDSMVHNPGQPVNLAADSGRPSGRCGGDQSPPPGVVPMSNLTRVGHPHVRSRSSMVIAAPQPNDRAPPGTREMVARRSRNHRECCHG